MQSPEPRPEHLWLKKFIGVWDYESAGESDSPEEQMTGTETVRAVGDLWIAAEGVGKMPDGTTGTTVLSIGFDPSQGRFVGSWIGSMMNFMFVYQGRLDESGRILILESEGPSWTGDGSTVRYRDVHEFVDDDTRTLRGQCPDKDGTWQDIMTVRFKRRR